MTVRPSDTYDLPALLAIFDEARRTIAALGIDQWQNGYPNRSVIEADITQGQSYCVMQESDHAPIVCGTFALITGGEPTYDRIFDGSWLTADRDGGGMCRYVAIHRVAVSVAQRGCGVSTAILDYAADFARARGCDSLRIDTHEGNVVMRRMLEKHGFTHCGTIYLENGDKRVAYEKRLL